MTGGSDPESGERDATTHEHHDARYQYRVLQRLRVSRPVYFSLGVQMAMQEEDRKYSELEERFRRELKQLEGRTLRRVLLQVVAPEINVVYLELDDGIWGIQGAMGSELLRLAKVSELPSELGPRAWYEPYVPGEQFAGSAIRQARAIGFAWNGHGAEFSFAGHQKATLLVQSIYAGDVPEGFGDCLRIGIGLYDYERQNAPDA